MEFCLQQILKKPLIDHYFIFATLNKFGFGSDFIQWIKTLFKNSQSCVMNNGTHRDISILRRVQDRAILYLHISLC